MVLCLKSMGRNVIKQAGKEKMALFKGCSVVNLKPRELGDGIQKWSIQLDDQVIAGTYTDIARGDKNLKDTD